MTNKIIAIIEDEEKIAHLISDYLKNDGFETCMAHHGNEALETIAANDPALVILDLMLPGIDGLTICRELRKVSQVPIIMLTARVDEIDRLTGLESGADDYVCKPFLPRELVARVKAILRRSAPQQNVEHQQETVESYKMLALNINQFQCYFYEQLVALTPVEFRIAQTLISFPGKVYSREELIDRCYPDGRIVSDRTVDSHIKNLRKKLAAIQSTAGTEDDPEFIQSVYGVGYKVM